jgi:hypothetical protein
MSRSAAIERTSEVVVSEVAMSAGVRGGVDRSGIAVTARLPGVVDDACQEEDKDHSAEAYDHDVHVSSAHAGQDLGVGHVGGLL